MHSVFPYGQRRRNRVNKPVHKRQTRTSARRRRSVYSFESSQSPVSQDLEFDQASVCSVSSIAEEDRQELPNTPSPGATHAGDCGDGNARGSEGSPHVIDVQNPARVTAIPSYNEGVPEMQSREVDANTLDGANKNSTPNFYVDDGELLILDEDHMPALSASLVGDRELSECIEDLHSREKSQKADFSGLVGYSACSGLPPLLQLDTKRIMAERMRRIRLIEREYRRTILW